VELGLTMRPNSTHPKSGAAFRDRRGTPHPFLNEQLTFPGPPHSGRSAASAPITVCSHAFSSALALRIRRRAQSETALRVPTA
jgi:hypothetical protein